MRLNLPVTQEEFDYSDDATLLSVTDTQSRVTYANAAFVHLSGFTREELIGQPHNLVRHPDMPSQAFEDMWQTLKAGQSWSALVKNRRKTGDHYWVRANATPVRRHGQLVGYLSVRTKPTRAEIAGAEALYAQMREGKLRHRTLYRGLLIRTGFSRWASWLQTASVGWRIGAGVWLASAGGVGLCAAAGLRGSPLAIAAGAAALSALTLHAWLRTQIARPLATVLSAAQAAASGNPQRNVTLDRVDEIGMLLRAVNQSALNVQSLVEDIAAQTAMVHAASGEIASGNVDLSTRTEQTVSSLQVASAAMEHLGATVRRNADNARQASAWVSNASTVAQRGAEAVGQVAGTMKNIGESSRRIVDIIAVIDSIAFQTNILALNASVEAARAGVQGLGFSVVAEEVRGLAGRSAAAAREIMALIGESVQRVEQGAVLVAEAERTMSEMVGSIRRVTDIMEEIGSSSANQSTGVTRVSEAVSQIDKATQQNAALVEESAAAAASLRERAGLLVGAVEVFKAPRGMTTANRKPVATDAVGA